MSAVILSVMFKYCYAERRYAELQYTDQRYAECSYAECRGATYIVLVAVFLVQCWQLNVHKKFHILKQASLPRATCVLVTP